MNIPTRFAQVLLKSVAAATMLLTCQRAMSQPPPSPPVIKKPLKPAFNIVATVLGPNTVKINWSPLQGANLYRVYRDGLQIGPDYPSAIDATQPITVYDYGATPSSTLSYSAKASHKTVEPGLPGTPAAGKSVTLETLMMTSNTVVVKTPERTPVWGFADLHAHPATFLAFGADANGYSDLVFNQNNGIFWGKPGLELASSSTDSAIGENLPGCNR